MLPCCSSKEKSQIPAAPIPFCCSPTHSRPIHVRSYKHNRKPGCCTGFSQATLLSFLFTQAGSRGEKLRNNMRLLSVNQVIFTRNFWRTLLNPWGNVYFLTCLERLKQTAPSIIQAAGKPGQVRTCLGQAVTSPHASQSPEPRAACSSGPCGCDRANASPDKQTHSWDCCGTTRSAGSRPSYRSEIKEPLISYLLLLRSSAANRSSTQRKTPAACKHAFAIRGGMSAFAQW